MILDFDNWPERLAKIPLYQDLINELHKIPAERELVINLSNQEMIEKYNNLADEFNDKLINITMNKDKEAVKDYYNQAKMLISRTIE
jgi:hypothetical protein